MVYKGDLMKLNVIHIKYSIIVAVFLLSGCAHKTESIEKQLAELKKTIMQINAENANLRAKNAELDDKLLLVEKRTEKERIQSKQSHLKVIRLVPEENGNFKESEDEYKEISFKDIPLSLNDRIAKNKSSEKKMKKNEKRPVLRLSGSGYGSPKAGKRYKTRPVSASMPPIPVNRGDNLGVVLPSGRQVADQQNLNEGLELFNQAYRAFSNKKYNEALVGFSRFLKENPTNGYADNAMFWRGECYMAMGQLLKAIGEFERLMRRYPRSEKAPSGLYRLGFVYDRLNDRQKAREFYFKVVEQHPGSEAARKASRRLAAMDNMDIKNRKIVQTSAGR
jgi:tol-pal system protein YbgF